MRNRKYDASRVSMTLSAIAFTFAASVLAACSPQSNGVSSGAASDHIVNGTEATDEDAITGIGASVVFLQISLGDKTARCTGTLVRNNIVLTATHCVPRGSKAQDVHVISQLPSISKAIAQAPIERAVLAIANHPGAQPFFQTEKLIGRDDIALLLLDSPLPDSVKIAELPTDANFNSTPSGLLALGYGVSNDVHDTPSEDAGVGTLRYTEFDKYSFSNDREHEGMIQVPGFESNICHGDSGGPLMAEKDGKSTNVIVGVIDSVSINYNSPTIQTRDFKLALNAGDQEAAMALFYRKYPKLRDCLGHVSSFVNVPAHMDWIVPTIESLEAAYTQSLQK